jgi:hypothetical protein
VLAGCLHSRLNAGEIRPTFGCDTHIPGEIVTTRLQGHTEVLADVQRWACATAEQDREGEEKERDIAYARLHYLKDLEGISVWGKRYNSKLVNRSFVVTVDQCFFFGYNSRLKVGDSVYICPEKSYNTGSFYELEVFEETDAGILRLKIKLPFNPVPSTAIFSAQEPSARRHLPTARRQWKLWSAGLDWEVDPDRLYAEIQQHENVKYKRPLLVLRATAPAREASASAGSPGVSAVPGHEHHASLGEERAGSSGEGHVASEGHADDDVGELDAVESNAGDLDDDALEAALEEIVVEAGLLADEAADRQQEWLQEDRIDHELPDAAIDEAESGARDSADQPPVAASHPEPEHQPPCDVRACPWPTVSAGRRELAVEAWVTNYRDGLNCLSGAYGARDVPVGRSPKAPWELSLVLYTHESTETTSVVFVYWTDPLARSGRIVSVDNAAPHFITWPTAGSYPELELGDSKIIHPALGIHAKRSKDDRAEMLASGMRLKHMWEAAQCAQDGVEPLAFDACSFCASVDAGCGHAVRRCCMCLSFFHDCCASSLVDAARAASPAQPFDQAIIPPSFRASRGRTPQCALCAAMSAHLTSP